MSNPYKRQRQQKNNNRGSCNRRNFSKSKTYNNHQNDKLPDISSLIIDDNNDNGGNNKYSTIKIAVQGCAHGQLNLIYSLLEEQNVDLLIICGDFQSLRNTQDLNSMSCPDKYKSIGDFHEYYSGKKKAPILTLFVGGNHENSHQLRELYYGGWVCPNIYYLGHANVVNFAGLRIAGLSGIYKHHDFLKSEKETPPFLEPNTVKSVYHMRKNATHRQMCLSSKEEGKKQRVDIMITHDWPNGIEQYGNLEKLLKIKPFFRQEIQSNTLGNPATREILEHLKPRFWFSAHMHVDFKAIFPHDKESAATYEEARKQYDQQTPPTVTQFQSLDKCIYKRKFLRILSFPKKSNELYLKYDVEWLAVLKKTHALTPFKCQSRTPIKITQQEMDSFQDLDLTIPLNFQPTISFYNEKDRLYPYIYKRNGDPQTDQFLNILKLDHVVTVKYQHGLNGVCINDENEIDLDDEESEEEKKESPYINENEFELDQVNEEELEKKKYSTEYEIDKLEIIEKNDELDLDEDIVYRATKEKNYIDENEINLGEDE